MANVKHDIEISKAFSDAIDRTKKILFDPFDIAKWFIIGFCAWLANLGKGGLNLNFNSSGNNNSGGSFNSNPNINEFLINLKSGFLDHMPLILTIGIGVFTIGLAIGLVLLWLRSRGAFMLLDCVACNKAEVSKPWKQFKYNANSLFMFQLILAAIQLLLFLGIIVVPIALFIINASQSSTISNIQIILGFFGLIFLSWLVMIPIFIIKILTKDFVVPIMYMYNYSVTGGWKYFLSLLSFNKANFFIYLLFKALIHFVIGILIVISFCLSCCILGCLILIPYIGTVTLLPVFVFWRSFSICYLAQYGEQLNCIQKPSEPVSQQGNPEFEAPTQTVEETPEQPQFDDISEIVKEDDTENEDIKPEDENENKEGPLQ